jgi:hypothetical protein
MLNALDFARLDAVRTQLLDASFVMDVCVFFDSVNCSLEIPPDLAEIVGRRNISISISCYPTCFEAI